ncbi:glycosyltransferase family 4 protein [Dyadobacter sp. CY356]|uniref:glycosyltransferase family 4 protein n=1 Tax=Dyadobacter sp. CY356 TaxID=2906442 RepID=UPI001F387E14|nr:glycosyltransferase family 4 protein [Dyadobacter sp. CY356]MCF0056742.1 glycosyltransferase family 4 protein [Dyadobacter sp. CY356]
MKILFCTNTFENVVNGPSKFANYLLEINHRFQHVEIRILTEDISTDSLAQYKNKVFRLDLKLNFHTKTWGFVYRMFPYYQACLKVRAEYMFDMVVFNNAITGIWSAIKFNLPVIGMINDDNSASISWQNFDGSRRWFRHFIFKFFERTAFVFESGIIVNSHFLHDLLSGIYRPEPSKLQILHKGIRINGPRPLQLPSLNAPVKILFVKSDFKRGGLFDLLDALNLLKDISLELQIVGPKLIHKQEVLERNNSANVMINFIGPASEEVVNKLMLKKDFLIIPARQEAFGVANIEALATGLSVITSNVGGIPEVMDSGKNGWMIVPGNPQALAKIIKHAIENPQERLVKQQNGYDFVCQNFSYEQVLNRFLEILEGYKP